MELLGARLVRVINGKRVAGLICETEAYDGEADLACHARAGRTKRTESLYGPPGKAYIYFIYGMHWLFNCVTGAEGAPAAVLIRGLVPAEGLEEIALRRQGVPEAHWTDGPGRLTRALAIDKTLNGVDLTTTAAGLWIEPGLPVAPKDVETGPRVGINRVPEPWRSISWRYWINVPEKWLAA